MQCMDLNRSTGLLRAGFLQVDGVLAPARGRGSGTRGLSCASELTKENARGSRNPPSTLVRISFVLRCLLEVRAERFVGSRRMCVPVFRAVSRAVSLFVRS